MIWKGPPIDLKPNFPPPPKIDIKINPEQLKKDIEFSRQDKNHDGSVSKSEYVGHVGGFGGPVIEKMRADEFDRADTNHDGKLSRDEWQKGDVKAHEDFDPLGLTHKPDPDKPDIKPQSEEHEGLLDKLGEIFKHANPVGPIALPAEKAKEVAEKAREVAGHVGDAIHDAIEHFDPKSVQL